MENSMIEKTDGRKEGESRQKSIPVSLTPQGHHITIEEDYMNLATIQDISSNTGIPATTVRRYIQIFNDVLPQGIKLGRAWKYPTEMIDVVKMIHTSYQDGLSAIEIQVKLSDGSALPLNDVDTTTLSPQGASSLQEDIRILTAAIKTLTKAITTLSPHHHHQMITTEPPQTNEQKNESIVTTTTPPKDHTIPEALEAEPMLPMFDVPTTLPPDDHEADTKPMEDSKIQDGHGRDLTLEERDAILIQVVELYPGRENAQKRVDVLNEAGVPCGRGKTRWNRKKVTDNHRHALKRQAAK